MSSSFLPGKKNIDSVAVLPFINVKDDPDIEYLCDGITESLIFKLSALSGLKKVIARSSVFRYKGKDLDPRIIGQELDVKAVLISRVVRLGDELSVSVELVKTSDNSHIWGNQYKRKLKEIYMFQEEISNAIAENLRLKLTGEELKLIAKRYTENPQAYNLYLKGRYFWNKRTEEGYQKSLEFFQQAISKDTTFALAYTGIADYYNILGYYDYLPPKQVFPKAKEAVVRALEIDETLAEAHNSLAFIKENYDWDWEGAEKEYKRALELNPSYAMAHLWYAGFLGAMGRHEESIAENKRALELDPLSPIIGADLGTNYLSARQYDMAIEEFHKVLEMDPDYFVANLFLGLAYLGKERYEEAIFEIQKALKLSGGSDSLMNVFLGAAYAFSGKRDKAGEILNQLLRQSKDNYISPWGIALIYVGLNRKDKAFEWLEKAYKERDHWMTSLKVLQFLDDLRPDARYKSLFEKMNFDK